jgi:hypothetical protein
MADRRSTERVRVNSEEMEHIIPDVLRPLAVEKPGERLIVPPESLDRVCMEEVRRDAEDRTEPIRLSFLALLAERDPLVQARLNLRRAHAARPEVDEEEDRPTDPMILTAKFSG